MNWQSVNFDWNRARAFLATVEEGSLSAASRALGQTQPTLGRQITALEQELGVVLFERVGRSVELTPTGQNLVEYVRAMRDAAEKMSLSISAQDETLDGTVCITVSDIFAKYIMPQIIRDIQKLAPKLHIDIQATNDIQDLQRREADIAIRHVRPEQPDLIARLVQNLGAQFFCSTEVLDRVGRPKELKDMNKMPFIGMGTLEHTMEYLSQWDITVGSENVAVTSENGLFGWEMVQQGFGVLPMATFVGLRTKGVEPVLSDQLHVEFPVWLTTHRELHTNKAIRLVYDSLAKHLSSKTFWETGAV